MKIWILILFFLFTSNSLICQTNKRFQIFSKSDSVIIVSHEATDGVLIVEDSTGKRIKPPQLLISGKLNESIVKERRKLDSTHISKLTRILARPVADKTIEEGKCFIPHHAILIYKSGKISYLDICFGCRGFVTSKDLEFIDAFDKKKWQQTESFFRSLGITYEMPVD